ncbi:hypothetical protein [Actinocatenispora rupis]|uniref:Uncharacterized protein n=1 Tax=Actinocatenispora rupis TaxID=519421 RepID=A0A8J3NDL8_9ACTN|nr:hypothetical protein [Actinocatenispora rupis]GID13070.1 hypothetical protein Aru02nite_39590 [Actinocatenispora rupis]
MNDTILIDGRRHLVRNDGTTVDVDARPPADHIPGDPMPAGYAMLPCRVCRKPLALVLARRGAHIGCLPTEQAYGLLRICGAGQIFSTLITIYSGERPHTKAPRETRDSRRTHAHRARGGAAA